MKRPPVQGVTVLTPVLPGAEAALRTQLADLRGPDGQSPLARLPRTHFGRWAVLPQPGPGTAAPHERLPSPYLLFTSTYDGAAEDYLTELCGELAEEAAAVWGHCAGCPRPAAGTALVAYLQRHRVGTGLLYSAYPTVPVAQVRRCVDVRERLLRLVAAGHRDPAQLQRAFVAEFCS